MATKGSDVSIEDLKIIQSLRELWRFFTTRLIGMAPVLNATTGEGDGLVRLA